MKWGYDMSKINGSNERSNRKQYLLSYPGDGTVSDWLEKQSNKSQSLQLLIKQYVSIYGLTDVITTALDKTKLYDDTEVKL